MNQSNYNVIEQDNDQDEEDMKMFNEDFYE